LKLTNLKTGSVICRGAGAQSEEISAGARVLAFLRDLTAYEGAAKRVDVRETSIERYCASQSPF